VVSNGNDDKNFFVKSSEKFTIDNPEKLDNSDEYDLNVDRK